MTATPWVIVPCSGSKRPEPVLPARERYTGPLHKLAMRAALTLTTPDRVRIQSARYGLLELDDRTVPYDMEASKLNADDARAFRSKAHCDACSMYWKDGRRPGYEMEPVIALVPVAYLEVLEWSPLLNRALVRPLAGCGGIGVMRQRLSAIANGTCSLDDILKDGS